MLKKRYLITSALPYANGALHLGHLAGAYLPADIFVRYLRLMGADVVWVCGSDEHGAAITLRAKKEDRSPKDIIDTYHNLNKSSFEKFGISFDIYHRTSQSLHHETAQGFFRYLDAKGGEFETRTTEQFFDEEFGQFLADRYIKGTCPNCDFDSAFGDQCENCGRTLSSTELIHPTSVLSNKKPVLRETKQWFFRLDKHEAWLRDFIEKGIVDGRQHHDPKQWRNHVIGQCKSWLDEGLQARSITRDLDWGVAVPRLDAKGKVLYVWFDAPIGYISATRKWAEQNSKDWEMYWKDEETEFVNFIGKDNIVFHCIIFPAMLKAYGGYNLPHNVPANQFLNFEGDKFSKSNNWGLQQHEYLEEFASFPNHVDAMRYSLSKNMPENKDADFKWDEFVENHDKELVGNIGNLVNRVMVLTNKYFEGKLPAVEADAMQDLEPVIALMQRFGKEVLSFHFRQAIATMMEISAWGNTYLQEGSPWLIYKTDPNDRSIARIMFVCVQLLEMLSLLSHCIIPDTSAKIKEMLHSPAIQHGDLKAAIHKLENKTPLLGTGHQIGEPFLLFSKINDRKDSSRKEMIERQREKMAAVLAQRKNALPIRLPVKEQISFDDFLKLDMRTGVIVEAQKHPKADKLLVIKVDIGTGIRTVVSGIAEHYKPEELLQQQVTILLNLAPRKLRGIESQGMILMAENEKGKLYFIQTKDNLEGGWPIG